MYVGLERAQRSGKPALANLLNLHMHDSADFRAVALRADGTFEYPNLDQYFDGPAHEAYFITVDDVLAGFAMIRSDIDEAESWNISEFFVARTHRRSGVGSVAARGLMVRHPGMWTLHFDNANLVAAHFWPQIAESIANGPIDYLKEEPPHVEYAGIRMRFRVA